MDTEEFRINEQFLEFKGQDVIVGLRNNMEFTGKLISIDNYLNSVLEMDDGSIQTLKGGEVNFIALNDN